MNSTVKESKMVSPYLLFFLIHSTQIGVSILKFQNQIMKGAGHDAWMVVLVMGLIMHIPFMMILYILKQSKEGDVLTYHKEVFGKVVGGILNIMLATYFSVASLFALHSYIDVLQVWVFDGIANWEYSLLFSFLIFYTVVGGFRIISAMAYWGVVIPSCLLFSLIYFLDFVEVSYILPFFQHSAKDFFVTATEALPLFLGFETILVFFPFIKNREKASKWGHIALLCTTFLYAVVAIVTFMFFTQGKLELLTWPTLTMIKIIQFPFLERFEFIFIFTWLLVVMPVICIYLWSAIRSIKLTVLKVKPSYVLIGLLTIFYIVNSEFIEIKYTYIMAEFVSISGSILLFCYIPFLFLIAVVRNKLKNV